MGKSDHWTAVQNQITVQGYLDMLAADLRGEKVVKKWVYEEIAEEIDKSPKAVEFKFQNVSAVLQDLDLPWVIGLPPRSNFQSSLHGEVVSQFADSPVEQQIRALMVAAPLPVDPAFELAMTSPPDKLAVPRIHHSRRAIKTDYLRLKAANLELGLVGEEAVVRHEIRYLRNHGREDLAGRVRHVSQEDGDGLGYDVLSFRPDGQHRYIEVKTTRRPKEARFYVSRNELAFSQENRAHFSLYRVCNWERRNAAFYALDGAIDDTCDLWTDTYLAHPKAPLSLPLN